MKTPEDEEFERIERDQKKIIATQALLQEKLNHEIAYNNFVRNQAIEEVAQEIEKFKTFGADTISSFASYIRSLKK